MLQLFFKFTGIFRGDISHCEDEFAQLLPLAANVLLQVVILDQKLQYVNKKKKEKKKMF